MKTILALALHFLTSAWRTVSLRYALAALLLVPLAALHAAEPVAIDLSKRTWQGIPGLERTAKGRVFVSWFTGGTKEPEPENTVLLSQSDDGAKTFSEPQAMGLPLNDGTRCYDPCLWIDSKGRLWYLFNRSVKDSTRHGVYARICDAPDASEPVWGAEFRVGFDGPFSFRMNKPTVLSSGEWVMPVIHALEPVRGWVGFDPKQVHGVGISTDEGKTWSLHGDVRTPKAGLENMIVELRDGRLWMLVRTEKVLWESHSSDKGRTWSDGKPSAIATPHSRFFIRRLSSGNLLLVNHYKFTGRSHLTAQLSTDDGATWSEGLLLDERSGVSYPDGVQDKDGLIWITYDRDRGGAGEILLAKFKEEDVIAGKNASGAVHLRQVVNKINKLDAKIINTLSAEEADRGFVSLFDGVSFDGWEQKGNWAIEEGAFARTGSGGPLTYVAKTVPDDFEARFEWKVSKGCNSGVYYRPGQVEYQVLDNVGSPYGENPRQAAASLFFCMAPLKDATRALGEWQTGRIVCKGTVIQHWLNGVKVIDFDYTDPKWLEEIELLRIRGGDLTGRGSKLWLQDHGAPVWFRKLRWREIPAGETVVADPTFQPMPIPAAALEKEKARVATMLEKANSKLPPPDWDPKRAGDEILAKLVKVTAPQAKGAHDAEFVCVGDRAYIVEHDNDLEPGHGAGAAQYCVLSIVNLKTRKVEKTIPMAKSEQAFDNVTLPKGMCFVPRIIRKNNHTLRTYFCSQPAKEEAVTWYRDFDLGTQTFEGSIHKAKLKTAAGVFDMEPLHFHADAAAQGFTRKAVKQGLFIFDSFKEFDGRRYVVLNNFPGKQNALAVLHDDFKTFEVIGHYNEPQSQQLSESAVNRLPDGTWMAICRNDAGNYHFTTSKDGKTWTIGQPMSFVPNGLNSKPTFDKFGDVYYLGWQENTKVEDCGRSVFNVDISRDGRIWERKYRFESPHSFQYPTFHEHEGVIWLTVTQSDHKGSSDRIMFGKLEDLPKPNVKVTQELLNSIHVTPKLILDPMPAYGEKYLPFAMAASMESTHKGRLWTCWAGGQDGPNAYLLASYSDDQGKSWRDPVFVIDPQAQGLKMGTRLGSFWCDPKGRLWLFFHQSVGMFDGSCSNWYVRCDEPDAAKPVWTEPVYIGFGASLNKPIVRKNGEWILPVSLWERWHIDKPFADCYHELDAVRGSNVFVSDDEGGHWRYRGGIIFKDSCFNEHSVVELSDGQLWMLSRGMKETFQSFSDDGGKTWQPQSTAFPHVNSKAVIRRLQSGNLLVIRHGQEITKATPKRQELTAFLSTDDGKTWSGKLLLDERTNVSYPDIAQAPNGDIYVHYDRSRTDLAEILFARFREEDVQAGKLISKDAALKNFVKSKQGMNHGSSGGKGKDVTTGASVVSPLESKVAKFREDLLLMLVPPRVREFNEPKLLEGTQHTAFPGIARTPRGRLWVCWGAGEDGPGGYSMMASSDDDGQTWSGPRYILKEAPTPNGFPRSINGTYLWTDPKGRLWWLFPYSLGIFDGRAGIWGAVCENPDADKLEWSVPRRLADGEYVNKPVILRDGSWLLSATVFPRKCIGVKMGDMKESDLFTELDPLRMSNFFISKDDGATWERRGGVTAPPKDWDWDEPHFIEKSSGELRCLLRTHYGLCESRSSDGARNWSPSEPSKLVHTDSRIFTMKLQSGKVLLVKHGQLFEKTGRTHLTAYLSDDEGETWHGGLLLEERPCSYPDGIQSPDGRIHIVYDQGRTNGQILMATVREEDVRAGKLVSKDALLKTLVRSAVRVKLDGADAATSPKEAK